MIKQGIAFVFSLMAFVSFSQPFELEFEQTEDTIHLGEYTSFFGELDLNSGGEANFDIHIHDIDFPIGWGYVLCTPDICLPEKTTDFSINFDYNVLTSAADYVKIQILTSTLSTDTIGTLNLSLVDTNTGDSVSFELKVYTEGVLSLENPENAGAFSIVKQGNMFIVSNPTTRIVDFQVYDFTGRMVHSNHGIRKNQYTFSLKAPTNGVYYFVCTDEFGNRLVKKNYFL